MDSAFSELVEREILATGCLPPHSPTNTVIKAHSWSELRSWREANETLVMLGFQIDAADCWQIMGLDPESGPIVSADLLDRRLRVGSLLVSAGDTFKWCQEDRDRSQNALDKLVHACRECHQHMPDVLRLQKKRKAKMGGLPTWQEPSPALLEFLRTTSGSNNKTTVALHLSNLQRMPLGSDGRGKAPLTIAHAEGGVTEVLGVSQTRNIFSGLLKGLPIIKTTLAQLQQGTLITWSPENSEQIHRVMQAIQEVYTEQGIILCVKFLVPYVPFPDCTSADLIHDVWTHPLLHNKHENMIAEVQYLREPSRCVFSGDFSPIHQVKAFAVITAQAVAPNRLAHMTSWRPALLEEEDVGQQVFVDCPLATSAHILQTLISEGERVLPGRVAWALGPRSLGSCAGKKRVILVGGLGQASYIELLLCIDTFRKLPGLQGCLVGRRGLFSDRDALVVDCDEPEQLDQMFHLCEEAILVSRRKALISPRATAENWRALLTNEVGLNGVTVRHRKSGAHGGKVFAKAAKLHAHVQADRLNKAIQRLPTNEAAAKRLQVVLELPGVQGERYEGIPKQIMQKVAAESGIPLPESSDQDGVLKPGEWRAETANNVWTGKIILQCSCSDDISKVFRMGHGRGINLGGVWKALEVSAPTNPFLSNLLFQGATPQVPAAS